MRATRGTLLDGRVAYAQPAQGFRSGIEPVLLAAAIDARPGQTVLEAGTGAGAGLLCLMARVAGLTGIGIERDPALAALAAANARANRQAGLHIVAADIAALPLRLVCDHAFANPPYHAAGGTPADAARRAAKQADAGLFDRWIAALAAPLRHRGTLTLIVPPAALPACIAALAGCRCPADALLPLWPKPGRPARLALLRGIKGGRGGFSVLPGLVLHRPDGAGFTAETEAVLRHGAAQAMA
jgi:tRNA1Val (adenine37-N6)-methyltransferase